MIIAITPPDYFKNESKAIESLLNEGVSYVHVRKPKSSSSSVAKLINTIDKSCYNKLSVHYYYDLCSEEGVGGFHESRGYNIDRVEQREGLRISRGAHSFNELKDKGRGCNYIFLSPVFNSISKSGYLSAFDYEETKEFLHSIRNEFTAKIVALGGVSPQNIEKALETGFDGVALIGSLWSVKNGSIDIKESVDNYKLLKKRYGYG
ncbi:thiamine phosphate synthase [Marinilabiliaceae bacterium ANBcel2]|nr:thiamine phosphate synthase [Marinilabiliaceae bacterium ANBcel2]